MTGLIIQFTRHAALGSALAGWVALAEAPAAQRDWPQFFGPNRDGEYLGGAVNTLWPPEGPRKLWSVKVGEGFSSPVAAGGKVLLYHRIRDEAVLDCLELASGKPLWTFRHPTKYVDDFGFESGPRSTPAIVGQRAYLLDPQGMAHCVDLEMGRKVWAVNLAAKYGAGKGFFGMSCSPLVRDGLVLLNIGGAGGAGIVALDADSGALRWKATEDEASYSSPVAATFGGKRAAVFFSRSGLVVAALSDGAILGTHPWRPRMSASVSAATPLVVGERVFLTSSYDTGAVLLEWRDGRFQPAWSGQDGISSHYASVVHKDGWVYGFDGRQEMGCDLVALRLEDGKVGWRKEGFGAGTMIRAGETLLALTERGELVALEASPEGCKELSRHQVVGSKVRSYPALADGLLLARDTRELACFDLRPARSQPGGQP